MTRKLRSLQAGVVAALVLVGCEDLGLTPAPQQSPEPAIEGVNTRILKGEVERADVFRQVGNAVWDGRPTLGGTWVASKNTQDLERVRITRTDTGQSIVGALFRIEPTTPGPSLVVSSDAARALGFVAGTPTEIEVIALRAAEAPAPAPEPEADPSTGVIATSELEDDATPQSAAPDTAAEPQNAVETSNADAASTNAPVTSPIPTPIKSAEDGEVTPTEASAGPSDATVEPQSVQSPVAQPVLQIGTFDTEAEADIALAKLASQELSAQKTRKRGLFSTKWVVYAGPFASPAEIVAGRKAAAAAGFDQAIVTTR